MARHISKQYEMRDTDTDKDTVVLEEKEGKVMHRDLLNANVLKAQYAVRGELYLKAEELKEQGRKIISTNTGNPQALGAKPLTFIRQVMALCIAPFLLEQEETAKAFPADVVERAQRLLKSFGTGGVGGYTDSRGNTVVRNEVADFIAGRDGVRPNPEQIFLTDGASTGVKMLMQALIRDERDAVLVPIPQYPLYSASCTLFGGTLLPYMLEESSGWGLSVGELTKAVTAARRQGLRVRGLVFINPGNPTGQTLSEEAVKQLVRFCYDQRLVLLADEVYQGLTYRPDRPFVSAFSAMHSLGAPYADSLELVSYHSVSKGVSGECGLRGGYCQLTNIHEGAFQELYKLASVNLCPNTMGQVAVSCMCDPPRPGDPSWPLWEKETTAEYASLKRRAALVSNAFSSLPGMSCNPTEGAMYAFPKLDLPEGALSAAAAAGKAPDVFYCLQLLEATGISTVPGSGFGQEAGTAHFRTTILPREEVMEEFVEQFRDFQTTFMNQHTEGSSS